MSSFINILTKKKKTKDKKRLMVHQIISIILFFRNNKIKLK